MSDATPTRRIAALLAGGALLAGCTTAPDDAGATDPAPSPSSDSSTTATTPDDGDGADAGSAPADDPAATDLAPEVAAALEAVIAAGAVAVQVDVRDGDQATSQALGVADIADDRAAQTDDPVRIASISKTVLAVVVLQLVEEGALTLDTTVEEVLPGLLHAAPTDITVRQLLEHTSGLPNYTEVLAPDVETALTGLGEPRTPEELVELSQQQPWVAEPGTAFNYSHVGYTVLGLMAEKITGQSVPDLMAERVFEPVGMDSTLYPTDEAVPDDALRGYLTVDGEPVDATASPPWFWSFGASLISTVGDVGSLVAAVNGGELLEPTTLEQMRDVGADGYGFGVLAGGDACGAMPPELVYGQRGNGFGYNSISFGSDDGERVVTVAYTGGAFDPASDPVFPAVNELLVAALGSTCPA